MAKSTGPILAVGAVTIVTNEVIGNEPWAEALPIVIMTSVAALMLAGLEHLSSGLAIGLAWLALVTRVFVVKGKQGTPAEAFLKWYGGKK